MTVLRSVRVAAVQATPVVLDAAATIDKAVELLGDAASRGAELIVFPECFVSLYPSWSWAGAAMNDPAGMDEVTIQLWQSSVAVPGPEVDRLVQACAAHNVHCVIGVNEREPGRSFSVYNTMLTLGPSGLLARHRKLMPTRHERLFHAFGRGDDLTVVDTPAGRIGGLICWENRMPLARYAVYRGSPQIYVAPTADPSDGWQALMRTVAIESGAFVVSAIQYTPTAAYPKDFPIELPDSKTVSPGGSCIVGAGDSGYLAEPLYGDEGILIADCDLRAALTHKSWFDVTGHYSCEDALLRLLTTPDELPVSRPPVTPAPAPAPPPVHGGP
jgi:nitrilase